MVVEKIGIIKTGDFTGLSNLELLNTVKYRAIVLSRHEQFKRHLERIIERNENLNFNKREYNKYVSKRLRNIIAELETRIGLSVDDVKVLRNMDNCQLNTLFMKEISKLWNNTKKQFIKFDLFLVFYQENLRTLLDEVYYRYSGINKQKFKQQILNIKNGLISYKRLLAKLLGEKLIKLFERIEDYENTSDEEAEILGKELANKLKNTKKWYLSRDKNLKFLCRMYGSEY